MSGSKTGARRQTILFLLLCVACVLGVLIFGFVAVRRSHPNPAALSPIAAGTKPVLVSPAPASPVPAGKDLPPQADPAKLVAAIPAAPARSLPEIPEPKIDTKFLFFEANALGGHYGKAAVAAIDKLDQPQYSDLSCDRVHFSGGKGICLAADRGVFTTYSAVMFDAQLKPGWSIPLNGVPSRTRVSPSGRLGAITIFLSGHSYTSLNFSTQTTIVDTTTGKVLADLEKFSVTRDGVPFASPDFNFWGVTFKHDESKFYATLWSKGRTYLVAGSLKDGTAQVIHDGVECPSLSPDNTRIAFKKRVDGAWRVGWRLHILDLKTMIETPLRETRSVDDQVEWLDNQSILYALSQQEKGSSASTDIWVSPATAGGIARILLKGAFSPAVAVSLIH